MIWGHSDFCLCNIPTTTTRQMLDWTIFYYINWPNGHSWATNLPLETIFLPITHYAANEGQHISYVMAWHVNNLQNIQWHYTSNRRLFRSLFKPYSKFKYIFKLNTKYFNVKVSLNFEYVLFLLCVELK